jgi:hypothetical protein
MRRQLIYLAIAVALFLVLAGPVETFMTQGKRLTRTTVVNGNVGADPHALALQASEVTGDDVSDEEYALARMVGSEEEAEDDTTKIAIAWTCVNDAAATFGGDIIACLTFSTAADRKGYFGDQTHRRYSTARDPYEGDLALARAVLSGSSPDQTGGAVNFFRARLQDILYAQGKVKRTGAQVDADWTNAGKQRVDVPGADPAIWFYRKAA